MGTVDSPSLPPGVPPSAVWSEENGEWQQRGSDDAGLPHGPSRSWRADGSLRMVAAHHHGRQIDAEWRFHPDGSLASAGYFVDGTPRGVHRRYASSTAHAERLQSCCVPPGAWQLRQDYRPDGTIDRSWFDRHGTRLLETGEPYPRRPASVPAAAWFDEHHRVWDVGVVLGPSGYSGTRSRFSETGVLQMVEDLLAGVRHGVVRSYNEAGQLAWEGHYANGHMRGPFRALDLAHGHFSDDAIRRAEGSFTDDQADGVWRYFDAAGELRQFRDLGEVVSEQELTQSPVTADEKRTADDWRAHAAMFISRRRVGEALLAAARAAAESGAGDELRRALAASTLPLGPEAARVQAGALIEGADGLLVPLVDGLKRGGDAPTLLWAIAKAVKGADRAALDFVTAAVLLTPDATGPLATRALLHAALGDLPAARADIARLATDSSEEAQTLELVLRAYFPHFDFWPAREALMASPAEAAIQPERTPAEVREMIGRYASRLARLRAELRARVADDVSFMIPDLSALLPQGPMELRRWTFQMSAEEYRGEGDEDESKQADEADAVLAPRTEAQAQRPAAVAPGPDGAAESGAVEISVDETRGLAADGSSVLGILRQARADWSAMTWLCWAVGLDRPALPEKVEPPAAFGRAAMMTMERTWRCRDKLNTSGLLALTKGVPGFVWEGTPIDLIPATLAEVALDEYLEARAVFSWLCDPANRSPWQDDLRID